MNPLSRRRFLKRGVVAGAAIALAGCGNDDASVFAESGATSTTSIDPTAVPTTAPVTTSGDSATDAGVTQTDLASTAAEATAKPTVESTAVPASAGPTALGIDFVYTMGSGGKQLNPYIAVWIESTDGTPLRTVALWFEQSSKGPRWLKDLTQWWRGDQARLGAGGSDIVSVVSSATRTPGSYSLMWDGLDDAGQPITDQPVVICIESARERGPYSFTSIEIEPATLDQAVALADDGELSGATVVRI